MASPRTNLEVYRGDDKTWKITFKDANQNPIDITGATVWFTVKENATDTDPQAVIQKQITTHTVPLQGETELILVPADTQNLEATDYEYDMQLVTGGKVTTFMRGTFNVLQDISISTS